MVESLVPPGKKSTDLTVAELAYISRKLKVDVMSALANREDGTGHPERGTALAYVAMLWKRRQVGHETAKIEDFTSLTFTELMALLETTEPDDSSDEPESLLEEIGANPTVSVPA
jgi:hypothetical protein